MLYRKTDVTWDIGFCPNAPINLFKMSHIGVGVVFRTKDDYDVFFRSPYVVRRIEDMVTARVSREVSREVNEKLRDFRAEIPMHVRIHLDNSREFTKIYEEYKTRFGVDLEKSTRDIMTRVCSDPSYNEAKLAHTRTMTDTFNREMESFKDQFNDSLRNHQAQVTRSLSDVASYTGRIDSLETKVEKLENTNKFLTGSCIVMGVVSFVNLFMHINK